MSGDRLPGHFHGGGALWNGPGYIAGESPGIVTVNSAPSRRLLYVMHRATKIIAGATVSAADGTYRIESLDPNQEFDVVGRDWADVYNDVIVSRVKPHPY